VSWSRFAGCLSRWGSTHFAHPLHSAENETDRNVAVLHQTIVTMTKLLLPSMPNQALQEKAMRIIQFEGRSVIPNPPLYRLKSFMPTCTFRV
jgi:hypothetical protein